ncbi:formate dehydrogenase accessory sulfurtransferase FdhD [Candidatus Bathyarchaeota archaeon A05DMB-2]|jgi:FdhD protein|nr:formate dehydrogenase accessory sulfurtransferase FdhD [Candidatus Bathyarchaeota archaeon A05DMB-2]
MQQVEITKYDLSTKTSKKITDYIAEEKPLHLFVNNTHWATILCSPTNLKEMAVGHLLSEGILKSTAEIEEIVLKENTCNVKLKPGINIEDRIKLSRLHARVIPSACGSDQPYQYLGKTPTVKSELTVKAEIIFDCVNQLNFRAEVFRKTGGVHAAAIYKANGALVAIAEDVGRHNAVDKAIGMAALNKVYFGECFLASTGRLSGDVAFKAARVGLPIIASLAAALSSGIEMAKAANLTLAGFVRGKRMNIYTFDNRILL